MMDLIDQPVDADVGEEEVLERSRRLTWPRTAAWCAYGCRSRPGRAGGTRACGASARTNSIIALANQLAEQGIQRVVLESTSDYVRSEGA